MDNSWPTFADLLLAFRQAKRALATERGVVGLFNIASFELHLSTRLSELQAALRGGNWFDAIDIGNLVVLSKTTTPLLPRDPDDIVRVGDMRAENLKLSVRLQLEPTPEFAIAEVLYLWEFGGALEALLDDCCVGYRLKRVSKDGQMDRLSRDVYDHWPTAFARYRDDPIQAAHHALRRGDRVVVTSTDVVAFFDSIDPQFLLQASFIAELDEASAHAGRQFSATKYTIATQSLLAKFAAFRQLRRSVGGGAIDVDIGVPIGALTSRVFANVALAGLDTHIQSLPNVILYRRYVDDIVVVTSRDDSIPMSRASVLGEFFPRYTQEGSGHHFTAPATGARFELKEEKTRVHDLAGTSGIDFLSAVQRSFSVVTSERRAFLGNVERLEVEFDGVGLFSDGAAGTDRIPRLRDADRFTLRRFMATAMVRGLERCALLLDANEASAFVELRTRRILSIIDGNMDLEDFEFALSLLRVAFLCDCHTVIVQLQKFLANRASKDLFERVSEVWWRGCKLHRRDALRSLSAYLRRRIRENIATACDPSSTRDGALLFRSGLRHLDREDDAAVFGARLPDLSTAAKAEHAKTYNAVATDGDLKSHLDLIRSFRNRSRRLGERTWTGMSDVGLLLSVRPPRYADVARRFLTGAEAGRLTPHVGADIDACVDALRGTRYRHRATPIAYEAMGGRPTLRVVADTSAPSRVRVILSNLPTGYAAFEAAAKGHPRLSLARLKTLDHALRDAQRAAYAAKKEELPSILVLPELSVPRRWTRALAEHAVRENLSIVAGIEYDLTVHGVVNQAMGIFPAGMHTAAIVRWTKRNPARGEAAELRKLGTTFSVSRRPPPRLVVESGHGRLGVLICSEILESTALADLSGYLELLLVPAWNHDTASFEHVVHAAASLLVHSFICVANNAEGSDTRIVTPIKDPRYEREWCRLVHPGANQVIWGDLPVAELRRLHDFGTAGTDVPRQYRPLPPDWRAKR